MGNHPSRSGVQFSGTPGLTTENFIEKGDTTLGVYDLPGVG